VGANGANRRRGPRAVRLSYGLAVILICVFAAIVVLTISRAGSTPTTHVKIATRRPRAARRSQLRSQTTRPQPLHVATVTPTDGGTPRPRISIGETVLTFLDRSRTMVVFGHPVARSVETVIRYPVGLKGRFPLIVFGHGYNVTPAPYSDLLDAWTRAGYVVAAPIFPLENANAPGRPNESDLPNQPADMDLVISSLQHPATAEVANVARKIDLSQIAVSGQSDGGDTALAAAYDSSVRDPAIDLKAAVILSGAEDPFARPFAMPAQGPPLLAIQGTDDTINPPSQTYAFFIRAAPPKYLVKLVGAGHLPPYTAPGPELTTVEHVTVAFLDEYLKSGSPALARYMAAGSAGPRSLLSFRR
jgi:dienelactone hydrolase